MDIDLSLFVEILSMDSTSSHERLIADFLREKLATGDCRVDAFPADAQAGEPVNLLFSWGSPRIVFCSHMDTVPPYIPPTVEHEADGDIIIKGRGACDAKGQILSMWCACRALAEQGKTDFGLLLLFGEETGSYGAKEYREHPGGECVIVGEPTDNKMVSASKGTKSFEVTIHGRSFHSGYPQHGQSAVERFVDMINSLRSVRFPVDPELGDTTYNVGMLSSNNPQNILSDRLTFRLYFRTTFSSDQMVSDIMEGYNADGIEVKAYGGDSPSRYLTLPGFDTTTVAFGSDAPQLSNFKHKILCGPGSILVAHRPEEFIRLSDIRHAISQYIDMYEILNSMISNHNL